MQPLWAEGSPLPYQRGSFPAGLDTGHWRRNSSRFRSGMCDRLLGCPARFLGRIFSLNVLTTTIFLSFAATAFCSELEDTRLWEERKDIKSLSKALGDGDSEVRGAAAKALAAIGDKGYDGTHYDLMANRMIAKHIWKHL